MNDIEIKPSALQITQTDAITAHFATLPIIDTKMRFLVRVLTPVELIPREFAFSADDPLAMALNFNHSNWSQVVANRQNAALEILKQKLLDEWHSQFKNKKRAMKKAGALWIYDVNKVELVECDLLVPKNMTPKKVTISLDGLSQTVEY